MSEQRDLRSLGTEMLGILWSLYLVRSIRLGNHDRLENLRELTYLDLLHRDVILRLCKFRDDDPRNLSFDQAWKTRRKRAAHAAALEGVESDIRQFAKLTQNLHKHRSNYVAHLAKQVPDDLPPPFEVGEATLLALSIIDRLLDEKCEYKLGNIDLRQAAFLAPEA